MIGSPWASSARFVEIPPEHEGQRIDNFLRRTLKGVPNNLVYRILRQGQVRVNRGRIRPDYRLQAGDLVRIPPLRLDLREEPSPPPRSLMDRLRDSVLLENQDVIVLNKPAGVAVHGGSGVDFGVIEVMRYLRPEQPYLELAHRLDRETSGCLVLAKRSETLRVIHEALRSGAGAKRYLALVRGRWRGGPRQVSAPLRKNTRRGNERMVEVNETGKSACSLLRPVSVFRRASLLEVQIVTGRTHQIRVHAVHIGHPVAGDSKYGDPDFNREMSSLGLRRLFLHAHSLKLPLGSWELAVSAPLEEELERTLECLGIGHGASDRR